jgi:aquaporin Z
LRSSNTTSAIYALSAVSGAHLSPAVSLGFVLRGELPWRVGALYACSQFAGAFLAAGVAFAGWGPAIALGASHPGAGVPPLEALIAEIVLTFMLMFVILATSGAEATVGKNVAIAVGMCVAACGFFAGPISGASMNPARSIAPQILSGRTDIVWIYPLGPCLGAALASAAAFILLGPPSESEKRAARGTQSA